MEEFLPEAMRLQHGKWMRAASEKGALPGSLIHPLRNVELLMGDGKYLKCHVSIGALADSTTNKEVSARRIPGLRGLWGSTRPTLGLCFAVVVPVEAETFEQTDSWKSGLNFLYGESVGQTIADGETPKQERYDNATVLFLDIVDFTKNCMRRKPDEVAVWMSKIHGTIEPLINKYCVRKIETRGDCYLVVAGTNVGSGDHSYDQVTRMVRFASEVSNNLRVLHNTFIRVGVASGPITIDYITTHVFAPVVTVYGETVCLAARMEQSGEPSLVHLSESSTAQLCREFDDDIKHTLMDKMEIKSQGAIATSWFSCTERCFTDRVGRPLQFPQHVSVDCVNFRLSEYKPDPNWSPVAVTRGAADAELESGGTSALRLRDSKRRSVPENLPTNSHSPVRSTSGGSWSPVDMANNLREKLMAGAVPARAAPPPHQPLPRSQELTAPQPSPGSNVGRRDSWASSPGRAVSGLFSRAGSN